MGELLSKMTLERFSDSEMWRFVPRTITHRGWESPLIYPTALRPPFGSIPKACRFLLSFSPMYPSLPSLSPSLSMLPSKSNWPQTSWYSKSPPSEIHANHFFFLFCSLSFWIIFCSFPILRTPGPMSPKLPHTLSSRTMAQLSLHLRPKWLSPLFPEPPLSSPSTLQF